MFAIGNEDGAEGTTDLTLSSLDQCIRRTLVHYYHCYFPRTGTSSSVSEVNAKPPAVRHALGQQFGLKKLLPGALKALCEIEYTLKSINFLPSKVLTSVITTSEILVRDDPRGLG
jgi:hypothetical protein